MFTHFTNAVMGQNEAERDPWNSYWYNAKRLQDMVSQHLSLAKFQISVGTMSRLATNIHDIVLSHKNTAMSVFDITLKCIIVP